MGYYKNDREWADGYNEQIINIIKKLLPKIIEVKIASREQDNSLATDMVTDGVKHIAVRIRRVAKGTYNDITVRSRRDTGSLTEIDKIKNVSHYFYGWIDPKTCVLDWVFLDVSKMIEAKVFENCLEKSNGDGTYFLIIPIEKLKETGCLIAESNY